MGEDTLLPFDLPAVARKKVSVAFDGGMLSSDAGVLAAARGGAAAGHRGAAGGVPERPPRSRSHRSHGRGDAAASDVCDRGGVRGRQRLQQAAGRSGVQDGGGPSAGERASAVLATDHVAAGERPIEDRDRAADGGRWWISSAPVTAGHRLRSFSTSTTPSTRCMAGSSCRCSTRTTTSAASCRSTSTRGRAASRWR